jgi:hypothetical protein
VLATPGLTVSRCDGPDCQHPEHVRGARPTATIIDDPAALRIPDQRQQDPAVHRRLAAEEAQREQARVRLRRLAGADRDPLGLRIR